MSDFNSNAVENWIRKHADEAYEVVKELHYWSGDFEALIAVPFSEVIDGMTPMEAVKFAIEKGVTDPENDIFFYDGKIPEITTWEDTYDAVRDCAIEIAEAIHEYRSVIRFPNSFDDDFLYPEVEEDTDAVFESGYEERD